MKVFGQEFIVLQNQLMALAMNLQSWFIASYIPGFLRRKVLPPPHDDAITCVEINGPGGLDRLHIVDLRDRCTVGCNLKEYGYNPPYLKITDKSYEDQFHPSMVMIKVDYFSVNYADVCIRWGLYESALRFVGWPIVPGFDCSGTVLWAGKDAAKEYSVGQKVFGFSLFGAYSKKVLVPMRQIRKAPAVKGTPISQELLGGVPAAAATALHAISLAGAWPQVMKTKNKACLIHSAAGGVGSQLIQIAKIRGYSPIVAVVGSSHKVSFCTNLGADIVIDKSTQNLWEEAKLISPNGYVAIFDANGIETIGESFEHCDRCGRLVVYGFHSNLPKASTLLSPFAWIKMIFGMGAMPKFDAMEMTLNSKTIAGFNLSFFEEEYELTEMYLDQIVDWLKSGELQPSTVTAYDMKDISKAHELIQSGQSRGKIVIRC